MRLWRDSLNLKLELDISELFTLVCDLKADRVELSSRSNNWRILERG